MRTGRGLPTNRRGTQIPRPFDSETPFDPARGEHLPIDRFAAIKVAEFKVVAEEDEYLECTTEKGRQILIAKPYMFRRSTYDGKTLAIGGLDLTFTYGGSNTRSVTDGTDTESQLISPAYHLDEIIHAVYIDTETDFRHEDTVDENGHKFIWMDFNAGGRCWCAVVA